MIFFREKINVFSGGWGLPTEKATARSTTAIKVLRASKPSYGCSTKSLNSHLCEEEGLTETFLKTATLSVLVWAYRRKMNTSNANFKNAAILLCVLLLWRCFRSHFFARINFKQVTSIRTQFAAVSAQVESVGRSIEEKPGSSLYLTFTVCDLKKRSSLTIFVKASFINS